jgi:hypothetical protein
MAKTNYSPTFPMYPGGAVAITPSNTVNLANPSVIYIGVSGNIRVLTAQGDDVTFNAVLAGTVLPVQVIRVWATNTTATNLIGIY